MGWVSYHGQFPLQAISKLSHISMRMGRRLGSEGSKVFVFQSVPSVPSKSSLSELGGWAGIQRPLQGRQGERGACQRGAALGSRPSATFPSKALAWPLSGLPEGPTNPAQAILTSPIPCPQCEPWLCVGGGAVLFSLKRHIPHNKCFDLFLPQPFISLTFSVLYH